MRKHIHVLQSKELAPSDLLGVYAHGAVVRSCFQNIAEMLPVIFSSLWNVHMATGVCWDSSVCCCFSSRVYKTEFKEEPEMALSMKAFLRSLRRTMQSWRRSRKAPGIDSLPADFHKTFWPVISEGLLYVLREFCLWAAGEPSSPSFKKGALDIKDWRPVSLLCTDYEMKSDGAGHSCRPNIFWHHYLDVGHFGPLWFSCVLNTSTCGRGCKLLGLALIP